jgi:hypothetical protein
MQTNTHARPILVARQAKLTLLPMLSKTQFVKPTIVNMPATKDLSQWGVIAQLSPTQLLITGYIENVLYSIESIKNVDENNKILSELRKVTVINKLTGIIINKFEDYIGNPNEDSFIRTLENGNVLHYSNNEQLLYLPKVKAVPFIPALPKDTNRLAKFATLDLETHKMNNGQLFIESAAVSVNNKSKSWHVMDYSSKFGDNLASFDLFKTV